MGDVEVNKSTESNVWMKMMVENDSDFKGKGKDKSAPWNSTKIATGASWIVNIFLLGAKVFVLAESNSKAVAASLADSAVDLVSQAVLSLSDFYMSKHSPNYPIGRSRLEALSVIACACIMSMASVEVIQYSAIDLVDGFATGRINLDVGMWSYIILSLGIFLKIALFLYCTAVNIKAKSDQLSALAEDHLNDVFSNSAAIVTIIIASNVDSAWWVDPVGAILISLVIIYRWIGVISEQIKKIVGHTAPQEFIDQVEEAARSHDSRLYVDCTRVYHFGARFNVEMEIVLPGNMTVIESHDIALALQHKIEDFEEVERAFVHVDHERRDGLEHKVERELVSKSTSSSSSSSRNDSAATTTDTSPHTMKLGGSTSSSAGPVVVTTSMMHDAEKGIELRSRNISS